MSVDNSYGPHANNIDVNFVKQYGKTLDLLSQVKGGKFAGKSIEESIDGENKFYDQLGNVVAGLADGSGAGGSSNTSDVNTFANSPDNFIEHSRRMVTARAYDVGLMLDKFDKVKTLTNPESEYVQQMVHALNRKKDQEFLTGALGSAATGVGGGTSVTLDTDSTIIAKGTGSAAGFTLEKIIEAKRTLELNDVDLDDPMNKAYIGVTPYQIHQLLSDEEKVSSSDYNTIKALVKGDVNSFYGFEFVVSNLIPFMDTNDTSVELVWDASTDKPVDGDDTELRACFAWVKSGVRSVTNPGIQTEVTKRADKRFNWYAYAAMRCGSVRMEGNKVVVIPSSEA